MRLSCSPLLYPTPRPVHPLTAPCHQPSHSPCSFSLTAHPTSSFSLAKSSNLSKSPTAVTPSNSQNFVSYYLPHLLKSSIDSPYPSYFNACLSNPQQSSYSYFLVPILLTLSKCSSSLFSYFSTLVQKVNSTFSLFYSELRGLGISSSNSAVTCVVPSFISQSYNLFTQIKSPWRLIYFNIFLSKSLSDVFCSKSFFCLIPFSLTQHQLNTLLKFPLAFMPFPGRRGLLTSLIFIYMQNPINYQQTINIID